MMKKLSCIIPALALVLFGACGGDSTEIDTGLNGRWVALNRTRIELNGMSYTRTSAYGVVDTGTFSAAAGYITFSRIGRTPETHEYTLDFPELIIGGVSYYHDSPHEPVDVTGKWLRYPEQGATVTLHPGKRIKDENKKDTFDIEGDFDIYMSNKGTYTISNRNLPGQSVLVSVPSHIHGTMIFYFMNIMLPISLLELFDQSIIIPPEHYEDVEEWWFTIDEVREFFEEAASKAVALDVQAQVFAYLDYFLSEYVTLRYDYTVEHDAELTRSYETVAKTGPNKLTLRWTDPASGGVGIYTYYRWDGVTGTK
jgi:hypothetical protein